MSIAEQKIPVPTATLDVSVQYKDEYLNNCTVEFYGGALDTGGIPLGDGGRRTIILNQTATELTLHLTRTPKAPQDDPGRYPVLAGDFPFGPVTANTRLIVVVAEPAE